LGYWDLMNQQLEKPLLSKLIVIGMLVFSSITHAETIDEVDAAFKSGDYPQALRMLRGLAAKNDVEAQYRLGALHESGTNIAQSYIEAVKWYRLAATGGNAKAQFSIASMYLNGLGVPQDFTRAHVWFNLAAIWGNAEAASSRDSVAKRMSAQQVAEAQKMARECRQRNYKGCD
jgi:TPR repeat protein